MSYIMSGVFRIGHDAEVRYVPRGDAVINLSLAANYGRRDDDGKQPTQWIEAGLWGERAEKLAEHLTRGKQVFCTIEDVHIETFTKSDGSTGSKMAGRIQRIDFVGPRQDGEQRSNQAPAQPRGAPPARQRAPAKTGGGFEDMDDDIPF